jgi:hypothetical protein
MSHGGLLCSGLAVSPTNVFRPMTCSPFMNQICIDLSEELGD